MGGGTNVYEYAGSNPNTLYDPTGEILPAVIYAAFWIECFNKCISRTSPIGTLCDAFGVDKYSVCAAKCTIQGFNPLKKIKRIFRFAFRIGGKSGVAGKAARKAARNRQRQSRRRNRRK